MKKIRMRSRQEMVKGAEMATGLGIEMIEGFLCRDGQFLL